MGAKFVYKGGELERNVKILEHRTKTAIRMVVEVNATRGEGYLKTQAPWTDQTGAARSGMFTLTHHEEDRHTILFAHSVHYGIWLEVKNSGEYEVIMPVVRQTGDELMADLDKLFRRLK